MPLEAKLALPAGPSQSEAVAACDSCRIIEIYWNHSFLKEISSSRIQPTNINVTGQNIVQTLALLALIGCATGPRKLWLRWVDDDMKIAPS